MARQIEKNLYQTLKDSKFSFMKKGIRTIAEIYATVRTHYPSLCDNSYYCSMNCKSGNNQPEWNHTVRNVLQKLRITHGTVRFTGRRGYWEFL